MIDIESEIVTLIKEAVSDVSVTTDSSFNPSKFPCVNITEDDNSVYNRTIDSGSNENHVEVAYAINIYSNKIKKAKEQCRELLETVDELLLKLGFCRKTLHWFQLNESTITRVTALYTAVISQDKTIYRG